MCMEDVRLARNTITTQTRVTLVAATDTLLVPARLDRYSLMLQFSNATAICVYPAPYGVSSTGVTLPALTETTIIVDLQHHGDLVTQPWRALAPVGTPTILITETVLDAQ